MRHRGQEATSEVLLCFLVCFSLVCVSLFYCELSCKVTLGNVTSAWLVAGVVVQWAKLPPGE